MVMEYARLRPLPPRSQPAGKPVVLVVGAYMSDQPTNVEHISSELQNATAYQVLQSWASIGGTENTRVPTAVTFPGRVPKYTAVNALLERGDLAGAEYLLVCDDDIGLPPGFIDRFLAIQSALGFALAQPARSGSSSYDHAIVRQCPGAIARQTLFVEAGPCFSAHRPIFELILPFDLASPMGWGYEYVWAHRLAANGLRMGIIDAIPVEHRLRPTAANYDRWNAYEAQQRLLAAHAHLGAEECHRVLKVFRESPGREGARYGTGRDLRRHPPPPG
jgi:hypothetical protein